MFLIEQADDHYIILATCTFQIIVDVSSAYVIFLFLIVTLFLLASVGISVHFSCFVLYTVLF